MALERAPELLTQRDIMLDPVVMEAAIEMNRQLACTYGKCKTEIGYAALWLANGRFADVGRAAEFVDENCKWGRLESARHSLRLSVA